MDSPPSVTPTPDLDEDALVARAQGDRHAFAALYRQYVPAVYRYCLRHLGSVEAAEDATSQIFTQALVALPTYRPGSFRAWLFTIAHHVVVDAVRRRRPTAPMDAADQLPDPAPSPEALLLQTEHAQHLAAVLAQLPPAQAQVLALRLAGLTAVEIAAVLGRSHGTIRNLQHRAIVRVRDLLAANHGGPDGD